MTAATSYLFLEMCVLLMLFLFWDQRFDWGRLKKRGIVLGTIVLFCTWTIVDQVALSLGIWSFPGHGLLGVRFLRLPLEEYIVFVIHSLLSITLIILLEKDSQ